MEGQQEDKARPKLSDFLEIVKEAKDSSHLIWGEKP